MNLVPDLVRDSKLNTRFHTKYTSHRYHDSGLTPGGRPVVREEYWRREKYIRGGSYGRVWLERCLKGGPDPDVKSLRAVKEVPRQQHAHTSVDYNRELEAMAKFSHQKYVRCFVKSFGWYENEEALFIAMEYCPEGDLHQYLLSSPAFQEPAAQQVSYQLMEGLAFLHENGFAHRDLKPSNILIKSKPPEQWWVKIGDFGISKRAEDGAAISSTIKGTLGYMPPELHGFVEAAECFPKDSHAAAYAADIWSLGEVVFQMLTREPSFRNMGLLFAFVQQPQVFPSDRLRQLHISELGIDFVLSLMKAKPKQRMNIEQALNHLWTEPWRAPSPRPPSIASTTSSKSHQDALDLETLQPPEPSGAWSTVSLDRPPLITRRRADNKSVASDDYLVKETGRDVVSGNISRNIADTANHSAESAHNTSAFRKSLPSVEAHHPLEASHSSLPADTDNLVAGMADLQTRSDVVSEGDEFNKFDSAELFLREQPTTPNLSNKTDETKPGLTQWAYSLDQTRMYNLPSPTPAVKELVSPEDDEVDFYVSTDGSGRVRNRNGKDIGSVYDRDRARFVGLPVNRSGEVLSWEGRVLGLAHINDPHYSKRTPIQEVIGNKKTPKLQAEPPVTRTRLIHDIELFKGNLVVDVPQKDEFLRGTSHSDSPERNEFTHSRYTAVTCSPRNFEAENYTLRPRLFLRPRDIELVVAVTLYDTTSTTTSIATLMRSIFEALHLLSFGAGAFGSDVNWKSVVVLVTVARHHYAAVNLFAELGLPTQWNHDETDSLIVCPHDQYGMPYEYFDDGGSYPLKVNDRKLTARIYEYTTPKMIKKHDQSYVVENTSRSPVQLVLCRVEGMTPAEDWSEALQNFLKPRMCIRCDVVSEFRLFHPSSIYEMWKAARPKLSIGHTHVVNYPDHPTSNHEFSAERFSFEHESDANEQLTVVTQNLQSPGQSQRRKKSILDKAKAAFGR